MLGDYVLHFPLTDFATSLLLLAAALELGRLWLRRPNLAATVDVLLVAGFIGALASVGSGLWLVAVSDHPHDALLSRHHYFAYGAFGVSAVSVLARILQRRLPTIAIVKTLTLVIAAGLVSGAGFYGGKMAHFSEPHEQAHAAAGVHDEMIDQRSQPTHPH